MVVQVMMLKIKAISEPVMKGLQAGTGKMPDKRDDAAPPPLSGPQILLHFFHLHTCHRRLSIRHANESKLLW